MRIGVLADTFLQRHLLKQVLTLQGYKVVVNRDPLALSVDDLQYYSVDAWLVDLANSNEQQLCLLDWLYGAELPVLFGEGRAPQINSEDYPRWQRALFKKLDKIQQQQLSYSGVAPVIPTLQAVVPPVIRLEPAYDFSRWRGQPAKELWLLAASLGGPAAVKDFLDTLPSCLPIGFLYAQHIDPGFEQQLPKVVGRHSDWTVRLVDEGNVVKCGEVVVVPIQRELSFTDLGALQVLPYRWTGEYSPSINQVMRNLAQQYKQHSGAVFFSGMGEDGREACAYAQRQGMTIWVQTAESCTSSSMPESILSTGCSSYSAAPKQLARALLNRIQARAFNYL